MTSMAALPSPPERPGAWSAFASVSIPPANLPCRAPRGDMLTAMAAAATALRQGLTDIMAAGDILASAGSRHRRRILQSHLERGRHVMADIADLAHDLRAARAGMTLGDAWTSYCRDAAQRLVLTLDTLRKRGDIFLDPEQ